MLTTFLLVRWWNYLRVRGEYPSYRKVRITLWELPPRARRIPPLPPEVLDAIGTTSACAENTPRIVYHLLFSRNYLRVRGEYRTL